jgi:hypothetical protein
LTWRRLLLGRNDDEPTANELLMVEEARVSDDDGGGRSEVTAEYADRRHGSEERWTARRTRPRIVTEELKHSAEFLANDTNNFVSPGSVRRALFADSNKPRPAGTVCP